MNLYGIVVGVIVVTLLVVSLSRLRKVRTKADYLVAGRTLPAAVLVFTLLSSWMGQVHCWAGLRMLIAMDLRRFGRVAADGQGCC